MDHEEIERIRRELADAFAKLDEELEQARRVLHTGALLGEKSLGHLMELEELKRRGQELGRATEEAMRRRPPASR